MQFGIIGSGSWGTALAKILTGNKVRLSWCVRNEDTVQYLLRRHHNPVYLSSVDFDTSLLELTADPRVTIQNSDHILVAVPSAYLVDLFKGIPKDDLRNKKIISAVKGILPMENLLLNDYLNSQYDFSLADYYTIMGPCHAEEVASEKLSYLTFSGIDEKETEKIARHFKTDYINVVLNQDLYGVQYAAVLKNIYALGAGIAHGLDYGDNFLSVFIANCADEMAAFLRKVGIPNMEVGVHADNDQVHHRKSPNYAASVYLGDLLVTCYSLYSRNRTFGTMIGKGYSVKTTQLEMNMVAEGYFASQCIYEINRQIRADTPILDSIHDILWKNLPAQEGFRQIEEFLV
jgi:glycerol-3-phosphate dehydrogenase (NAD(P)+)